MKKNGKKASDLHGEIKMYPQCVINIGVKDKTPIEELPKLKEAIEKVEETLGNNGRVLVRYSGTQNILRIMVETEDWELADGLGLEIKKAFTSI